MPAGSYAAQLRQELTLRNRSYARGRAHVESYGSAPVIVYEPDGGRHGNFFDAGLRGHYRKSRLDAPLRQSSCPGRACVAQAATRFRPPLARARLLHELRRPADEYLLTPGVAESAAVRDALGVDTETAPVFGWKARVPLANGRFDRTEVDMRFGSLLVEAKLTEVGFQTRAAAIVEAYRDFDLVFDRDLLPRVEIATARWMQASEFPENESQEFESVVGDPTLIARVDPVFRPPGEPGYRAINSSAAFWPPMLPIRASASSTTSAAPTCAKSGSRLSPRSAAPACASVSRSLTWQELAALLPAALEEFLDVKYGIVAPGKMPSPIGAFSELAD